MRDRHDSDATATGLCIKCAEHGEKVGCSFPEIAHGRKVQSRRCLWRCRAECEQYFIIRDTLRIETERGARRIMAFELARGGAALLARCSVRIGKWRSKHRLDLFPRDGAGPKQRRHTAWKADHA